jgi:hypothetical protein
MLLGDRGHHLRDGRRVRWEDRVDVPLPDQLLVDHITGDHQQMLRSFALIGQYVMPALRAL